MKLTNWYSRGMKCEELRSCVKNEEEDGRKEGKEEIKRRRVGKCVGGRHLQTLECHAVHSRFSEGS